jgi:ribosomal protein S18 acetylase RimI-like enzyme
MPLVMQPSWVGRRVTVRRIVDRGPEGRTRLSDVVGDLLSIDGDVAVVAARDGLVEVPMTEVAMARVAPPSTADELALEATAAGGWRAEQTGAVGGWMLRANGGFTGRANSVLPQRAPGLPLDEALATARRWYAARGLPLRFQLPIEARRLLDAELGERGWAPSPDVHVLVGRLDALRLPTDIESPEPPVTVEPALTDAWLAVYRSGQADTPAARGVLQRHPRVGFAHLRAGGRIAAVGRGVVDDGWLGVSAVEVVPAQRQRGHAQRIMRALRDWGAEQGAERSYLQVSSENAPALRLYDSLGYWLHHDYRYRTDPDTPQVRES